MPQGLIRLETITFIKEVLGHKRIVELTCKEHVQISGSHIKYSTLPIRCQGQTLN